jgi:hypothetical protein
MSIHPLLRLEEFLFMKFLYRKLWPTLAISLFAVALAPLGHAEKIWMNSVSGFWQDGTYWTGHTAPDSTSFLQITNDNSKTVTIDALTPATELTVQMLTINAPPGVTNTLWLNNIGTNNPLVFQTGLELDEGAAIHITNSALEVQLMNDHVNIDGDITLDGGFIDFGDTTVTARVGRATSGRLTINSGLVSAGTMTVGGLTNSTGAVNMNGGQLNILALLSLGRNPGTTGSFSMLGGQLLVSNDDTRVGDTGIGYMSVSNSTAMLTNLQVGRDPLSAGTLTLNSGGLIRVVSDVTIARFGGSTGLVTVTGGLLDATGFKLFAGRGGAGELDVSGGTIQGASALVAADTTNSTGAGGIISITGGGVILSSNFWIGSASLSTGQVFMSGGTLIVTNTARNAFLSAPSGSLMMSGGSITTDSLLLTNSAGQFIFNSGTLSTKGTTVANGAPFLVGDGIHPTTLKLEGGTHSFADGLVVSSNATLTGCGTVLGNIVNHGTICTNCGGSVVQFSISFQGRSGSTNLISLSSSTGSTYMLEYKSALTDSAWTSLPPATSGTGGRIVLQDPNAIGTERIYRVLMQ